MKLMNFTALNDFMISLMSAESIKSGKKNLILYLNDELEREIPLKILNYLS